MTDKKYIPDVEALSELFSALVEKDCIWKNLKYVGLKTVKIKKNKIDAICATGKTSEGKYFAALRPLNSSEIIVVLMASSLDEIK